MKTLFIGLSAALFLIPATARAQLVPDRTLGRESSVVVPVSNTREDIRGGARRGSNLFHSFREFNVNTNREVYFSNPVGVQNIINRVTGSNVSNIFGLRSQWKCQFIFNKSEWNSIWRWSIFRYKWNFYRHYSRRSKVRCK